MGFCSIYNKQIASICLSSFVAGNIIELGIKTVKEYRRKGLGKQTALAVVKAVKEQGSVPAWECMQSNIAS